jgi:predicted SAM-dependent methyltransferase
MEIPKMKQLTSPSWLQQTYRTTKTLCRRRALKFAARQSPCRIVLGASQIFDAGWTPTEQADIDVLAEETWLAFFSHGSIDAILAEHVWEHLTLEQGQAAAVTCFTFLKPGGYLRCAVPDGFHPDPGYIDHVRPDGTGSGADDHKVLYTYQTLSHVFQAAGFDVKLLEYFDEAGTFHDTRWSDEQGKIHRSRRYDPRNHTGQLNYTSVMLDAVKPHPPMTAA